LNTPFVSILIPVYQSQHTLAECLDRIYAQTYPAFEVILMDSDPSPETHCFVEEQFPKTRYIYSPSRLLPHAASNKLLDVAGGQLLAFIDPDIYLPPGWLAEMVAVHSQRGGVIESAMSCYGTRWLDNGAHLCKFDNWLPGGPVRQIEIGPTAVMVCTRSAVERVGGFEGGYMLGDTVLSWAFTQAGIPIWFCPGIVGLLHHYHSDWPSIVQERFLRGKEFGYLRVKHEHWGRLQILRHSLISLIIPMRLVGLVWRAFKNAARARLALNFLWHSPVVVSGEAAWLAGETVVYISRLTRQDSGANRD
jgi:GT2 family glycosyltransferase